VSASQPLTGDELLPWKSRPGETMGLAFERAKSERNHLAAHIAAIVARDAALEAALGALDHDPGEVDATGRYPVEVALEEGM
jgi:hypothetical protein